MTCFRGTPFSPGQARGVLRRPGSGEGILLVEQAELSGVTVAPAGLVVVCAAPFSHAMIRLLDFGVPVVMVDRELSAALQPGRELWMDGERGLLMRPAGSRSVSPPPPPPHGPVRTADGETLELRCTVANALGAAHARRAGAAAVGLVRTEYLVPDDGGPPDVGYYERTFADLCEAAGPLPVTLRLLDIAGDKRPPWLGAEPTGPGPLGMQGARLYHGGAVGSAFRAQVTAVGRLADRHSLRLLIPYLASPEEFLHWRGQILDALPRPIPVGAMVETPALAMMLDRLMDLADFVALGLNDLMQCLFAADRDQAELGPYLDPYAPALYRFLSVVAATAGQRVGRIQLCGLLPQLPAMLPVLLGLGFRVFSVNPCLVPYMARRAEAIRLSEARSLAERVCGAPDSASVQALLAAAQGKAWAPESGPT
jgi:phosphoenolpyruvate-protein phosphotransferase (PTS system enzyme I)